VEEREGRVPEGIAGFWEHYRARTHVSESFLLAFDLDRFVISDPSSV
jgi:hypothetical protein